MQLEQIMYQPRQMQRAISEQKVYTIIDLESLSANALYTGEIVCNGGNFVGINGFNVNLPSNSGRAINLSAPKVGMTLPGKLEIKKVGKNTLTLIQDHGLLRDLYTLHPDGSGALRNIVLTKGKSTLLNKKSF